MARTFKRRDRLGALTEINITPLMDLAFALLIIFMVSTPLLEQTIPIDLPTEAVKAQKELAEDIHFQVISIDERGRYFWGTECVSLEELDSRLAQLAQQKNPPVIRLRGQKDRPYQEVVTVMDLVKGNQLSKISFDTQVS
ncbi:MAG: hypothetical protein B7X06_03555 [Verrucomicrobia bacterium 21-51-4]|nr:MAG: hypothetical protein B7X06_03555 [Verrucomicrobia bacterium 21-51-4]HQU08540.1 biopolymer transporter ExbD [Opitutales bacterium]